MRIDRLIPAIAGLAAGFGVLLVSVDAAETPPTEAVESSAPTTVPAAPVAPTTSPESSTTLEPPVVTPITVSETTTTTTTELPEQGGVTFDLRCIGLDLGEGSEIPVPADAPELRNLMRVWVLEWVLRDTQLSDDDRLGLEHLIEGFDLDRCPEILQDLADRGELGDVTGRDATPGEAWLCAFADIVERGDFLIERLVENLECPDQEDDLLDQQDDLPDPTDNRRGDHDGYDFDLPSSTDSDTERSNPNPREP